MMKLFTKILAGCCALAMVFSLAACKDTPADEPDSTGDAAVNLSEATPGETVAQADDMSETAPEEDSAPNACRHGGGAEPKWPDASLH